MYITKNFLATDRVDIVAFMKQYSFATIITAKEGYPIATHLPFVISERDDHIILTSHFAKANEQWADISDNQVLVIFSEPHAYISPKHYDKEMNVPTWNYFTVHAYGRGQLITDTDKMFGVLNATIKNYEIEYEQQWNHLPEDYKSRMIKGIVAFEIVVTDLQAKKKLSQNRSEGEQRKIIESLSHSSNTNERDIAAYMEQNLMNVRQGLDIPGKTS
jgi:transcriptional regulator